MASAVADVFGQLSSTTDAMVLLEQQTKHNPNVVQHWIDGARRYLTTAVDGVDFKRHQLKRLVG